MSVTKSTRTDEPEMILTSPQPQTDAEYDAWLTWVHEQLPDEGENDADYR